MQHAVEYHSQARLGVRYSKALNRLPRCHVASRLWLHHSRLSTQKGLRRRFTAFQCALMTTNCKGGNSQADNDEFDRFKDAASKGNLIPIFERIMADHLTPVVAYRCLVKEDDREAPSFLFESVVNGNQQGRYSFVGARPALEILSSGHQVTVLDHQKQTRVVEENVTDPLQVPINLSRAWQAVPADGLPGVFTGGWVGYCGYDTVRYVYEGKLPFQHAPTDDRQLPDMHLALYKDTVLFDHATKLAYLVSWVLTDEHTSLEEAYASGKRRIADMSEALSATQPRPFLAPGKVSLSLASRPAAPTNSNMTKEQFKIGRAHV